MDFSDDNLLTDLNILNMIEPHVKLYIRNGSLHLDKPHESSKIRKYVNSLVRWYNHDTRHNTLLHIQNMILHAFNRLQNLKNEASVDESWLVFMYTQKLDNARNGLQNLKQTYTNDDNFCSKLDILIERIEQQIKTDKTN